MKHIHRRDRSRGFSLVIAIFVVLVLATLGAIAVRLGVTQQQAADFGLLEIRAQAAAEAGIEYGVNRALKAGSCPASVTLNPAAPGLLGYVVSVSCSPTPAHLVLGVARQTYVVSATAKRGTYGNADFVARSVTRTATNAPPFSVY